MIYELVDGPKPRRMLVLLHGHGSDESAMRPWPRLIDPGGEFTAVIPRGPELTPWGNAWFQFDRDLSVMSASILRSLDMTARFLSDVANDLEARLEEAVLCGFSQGGVFAMALGFGPCLKPKPRAVLGFCSFLVEYPGMTYEWGSNELPRLFLVQGALDPRVAVTDARAAALRLANMGLSVTYAEYDVSHEVAPESCDEAHKWLRRIDSEPLGRPVPG
jgi:predicted esterase